MGMGLLLRGRVGSGGQKGRVYALGLEPAGMPVMPARVLVQVQVQVWRRGAEGPAWVQAGPVVAS